MHADACQIIATTLNKWLDEHAEDVAVAHSAGLDSTVLLHALRPLCAARARRLRALHVNHGLQAQADAWRAHSEAQASALEVVWLELRVRVQQHGQGLEAAAREARYQGLLSVLRPGEFLLTAHHQEDQAETLIGQLLRGSGIDGLRAMRHQPERCIARPLLDLPRELLRSYAQFHQLSWVDDPSNQDPVLQRGWIRQTLWPVLSARLPKLGQTLANTAAHLERDASLLQMQANRALASCRTLDARVLRLAPVLALPQALQARVLKLWLAAHHLSWPSALRARLLRECAALRPEATPSWRYQDWQLTRFQDQLGLSQWRPVSEFEPANLELANFEPANFELAWDGGRLQLPEGLGSLELVPRVADFQVTLHSRRGGDQLRMHGRSKTLRKLCQECALAPWQRDRLILISERGSCIGVVHVALGEILQARLAAHGARLVWRP